MAIVLVVIGLIVGGVLVGRSLIDAAAVRSQVTQYDQISQGISTFRVKYGYLPGDIPDPDATRFGFASRGTLQGQGDGNGVLEAQDPFSVPTGYVINGGENGMLWVDLSAAKLIAGSFSTVDCCSTPTTFDIYDAFSARAILPAAKVGANTNAGTASLYAWSKNGKNFLGLSSIATTTDGYLDVFNTPLSPAQAQGLDTKLDDGLPLSGRLFTAFISSSTDPDTFVLSPRENNYLSIPLTSARTSITNASTTTCYDNGGVAGVVVKYSVASNPNRPACALSYELK